MVGSGSNFDVQVRLSTIGQDQLSSGLKGVADTARAMATQLGQADDSTRKLSVTIRGTDEAGNKLSATVRQLKADSQGYVSVADQLSGALMKIGTAYLSFSAIKDLAGDIFSATKAHEDMVTTMAATMTATNSWASSIEIADTQLKKLKETAALVNGSEEQMVQTFTLLKRTFGGTSDDAVTLTEKLALLARQSGASVDELSTRLAAASITGKLQMRGPAGIALTGAGVDPQVLMTMKEAGLAMDYLNATIADNPGLVERLKDGWSYLTAEFKKNKQETFELIGQGLEPLKSVLKDINSYLSSSAFREALAGWVKDFKQGLEDVGTTAKNLKVGLQYFGTSVELALGLVSGTVSLSEFRKRADEATAAFKAFQAQKELTDQVRAAKGASGSWAVDGGMVSSHGDYHSEVKTKPAPGRALDPAVWQDAAQKYSDFVSLFEAQIDARGLTGLDLALAKNEENWLKEDAAITKAQEAIDKAAKTAHESSAPYDAFSTTLRALNDDTKKLGETKAFDEYALKFSDALSKMDAVASNDTAFDKIEGAWKTNLRKINDDYAEAVKALGANPLADFWNDDRSQAAAIKYYNNLDALDASHAAAIKRNNEERALNDKTLLDESTSNWAGYYDDLVAKASKAGQGIVEAMQGALRTVADKAYANALTIGDGVQAALLKIRAELKTEGQIWTDYLTGIWGGITTGLGTVLNTLETGTGTIKDALKGILNSLLASFNTMVTKMVERWLLGKDQMAGGSSPLDSLFGGATKTPGVDAQGVVKLPTGWSSSQVEGGQVQGGPTQSLGQRAAPIAGAAVTGYGMGSLVGGMSGAPGFSTGAAIGGTVAAAGIALAAAGVFGGALAGAAAGSVVPVIGTIIGAIVGGLIAVLSAPNTESKVWGTNFMPQLKTAAEQIQSGVVDVYAKSLLPDTAGFAKSVNTIIKNFLTGAALFEVHAGTSEDITKDIQTLLSGIVPAELEHLLIGQKRVGGQDVAGISGASQYGGELDPNAPINKMLTDLGFTAEKVQQLAGQIDTMDPTAWMKQINDLVGIAAAVQTLGKGLSKTYAQTIADVDATAAKSPAGKLADQAAAVTDLLKAVSFYTGSEQITKGQEAIAAAQQFYDAAKQAMAQLSAMSKQIAQESVDSIKKIQDALKSPAELFAQSFSDLQHDYDRMRFAANPEDLAAAWAQAKTDFEAVASELVNRIKQIRTLLDDIHTLQAAMVAGPVPDAKTDPQAWLSQNLVNMDKYRQAMLAASPGSPEQIAAATSFAGLIRDRYQMEIDLLGRVKSTIESIDAAVGTSITQLQMQGMGSVIGGKWTPDVHAQGEFMMSQITALQGQLGTATTPEQVQSLVSQIQQLVGQLGGQQQDPTHYAESLQILMQILKDTQKSADAVLKSMGAAATTDISKLGPELQAAETAMQGALTQATADLDALVFHFQSATTFATGALNAWGVEIATQLNALAPILTDMVKNFTDVNTALSGGGTGGGKGNPHVPLGDNLTAFGGGLSDAAGALVDFTKGVRDATGPSANATVPGANLRAGNATAPPAAGVHISVTAEVAVTSGLAEDVARAVVDSVDQALYPKVVALVKSNNVELARTFRNNPSLLQRGS